VSTLFPVQIRLSVCKRVKTKEERDTLNTIKDLTLNTTTPFLDICRRYFKPITQLSQVRGISVCHTNESARVVNDFRQNSLAPSFAERIDGRIYYVGQTLRCRMYLKKPRLYINYCHDVLGFERNKKGDITGIYLEDIDIPLAPSLVRKHFIYNFASTCHSLQGQSASNGITLFDVEGWYCTREWFYTALTRTTSLSEVYFWDVEAVGTVTGLPVVLRSDFKLALEAKLSGYRKQDENAGRTWEPSDFVDGEYIMGLYDEQDGKCAHCAESFPPRWKPDNNQQPTVDRIDNTFAHVKGNCVLACLQCNRARH